MGALNSSELAPPADGLFSRSTTSRSLGGAADIGAGSGEIAAVVPEREDGAWRTVQKRFCANPWAYIPIPIIAGLVGYITNWMAVQMIFYPIQWRGIPIKVWKDNPFGILGWQGIVPAKTAKMSRRIVEMVTTQLIDVPEVFGRLTPRRVSKHLLPLVQDSVIPKGLGLRFLSAPFLSHILRKCTRDLQKNIESILNLKELVVGEMMKDRTILVDLFRKVGHKELKFLADSGLFFGFILGVFQMLAWILFPAQWTLPVGGAVVGYLTNWIALKMIFEPVTPVKILGLFEFQGMFLKRQSEVSIAFSEHLSKAVLTSQKMWGNMLLGSGGSSFFTLLRRNVPWFLPTALISSIFRSLKKVLPNTPGHDIHKYADTALAMKQTLIEKMELMTPQEFEGVLHPIFQEDELTLIIAGAVLGALAGAAQQAIGAKFEKKALEKEQAASAAASSDHLGAAAAAASSAASASSMEYKVASAVGEDEDLKPAKDQFGENQEGEEHTPQLH